MAFRKAGGLAVKTDGRLVFDPNTSWLGLKPWLQCKTVWADMAQLVK